MAEECVFCKILDGEIPAHIIYRDANTCAFLDNHPIVKGHTLVVPVRHYTRLEALPGDEAAKHLTALPRIVQAVTHATQTDGATVAWNNGPAAGQEVPHLHAHIVPRTDNDGFGPIHTMFKGRTSSVEPENEPLAKQMQAAFRQT